MAAPLLRGYDIEPGKPPQDVTELLAAGWTWSSGGVVSTAADATRFVRAYASGAAIGATLRAQQFHFIPGASEPPGPGVNAAGLAIFRYQTSCGTVYGHTGNTLGYTQFVAATSDGRRSATVSVTAQITPNSNQERFSELRHLFELAVCAATAS
jgi:D-alanyl-D-alanine carboxypeptidase